MGMFLPLVEVKPDALMTIALNKIHNKQRVRSFYRGFKYDLRYLRILCNNVIVSINYK